MVCGSFSRRVVLLPSSTSISRPFVRCKSLTAAIERGRAPGYVPRPRTEPWEVPVVDLPPSDNKFPQKTLRRKHPWERRGAQPKVLGPIRHGVTWREDHDLINSDIHSRLKPSGYHVKRAPKAEPERQSPRAAEPGPRSFQYTTAASEFIYGYSSVVAAIMANRRKLYKIYYNSMSEGRQIDLLNIIKAQNLSSIAEEVGPSYSYAMTKASKGRPHNGVILEASPLPVPRITELKSASIEDESFNVSVDVQSAEDLAINGKQELYSYNSAGWRYPLVLFVEGVVDEGNLGAIVRSAYFLGVDAVITSRGRIAPWSAITIKSSSGAAEIIPLFMANTVHKFLERSSKAGWKIYASSAYDLVSSISRSAHPSQEDNGKIVYNIARKNKQLPSDHCPVQYHPTILLLGSEEKGLHGNLLKFAHYNVGVPRVRSIEEIKLDSMNVSDAASIICYEMLRKPRPQPARDTGDVLL